MTSLICRFINRLKQKQTPNGPIQTSEIEQAEKLWIKYIQRLHYSSLQRSIEESKPNNLKRQLGVLINEKGILICKGRLENSDIDNEAKHPVLLPKRTGSQNY